LSNDPYPYGATDLCASLGIHTIDGAAWRCLTVFAMAGDASNAATPIADKIVFGIVLMFKPHVLGFSSCPLNKSRWMARRSARERFVATVRTS
jgi:hypothetical protein